MSEWKPTRWQRRDDNGYELTVLQQGDRFTWTVELGFTIRIDETCHRDVAMREAEEFAQDDYENQCAARRERWKGAT